MIFQSDRIQRSYPEVNFFFYLKCSRCFVRNVSNDWVNYKAKCTLPTLCTGDALNETFWNNKVICVAEKPPFKKNLVNKGIIKLRPMLKLKQACLNHGI